MGQSVVNAGTEHHYDSSGTFLGHSFYAGQTGDGHYTPSGDPRYSTALLNGLRTEAQTSRSAWEAALPTVAGNWYQALGNAYQEKLWRRFRFGPVFTE